MEFYLTRFFLYNKIDLLLIYEIINILCDALLYYIDIYYCTLYIFISVCVRVYV